MEKSVKTDLATAIIAAIAGVVIAFLVTNIFIPELENVSFKTLGTGASSSLTAPDEEVFNYRAVNPTVEVYVGDEEEDIEDEPPMEEQPPEEPAEEQPPEGDDNGATD